MSYYNQGYGQGSLSSAHSNNPFGAPDPSEGDLSDARSRFPNVQQLAGNTYSPSSQAYSYPTDDDPDDLFPGGGNWENPNKPHKRSLPTNFREAARVQQQQQQQLSTPYSSYSPQGYQGYQSMQYQQQQPTQSQYGMMQSSYGSPAPQSNQGYNPNIAQFDPYSQQSTQSWSNPPAQSPIQQPQNYSYQSTTSFANQHPRDYIRSNKSSLEAWDQYSWKQLLNSVDSLKQAWVVRWQQLQSQGYHDPNAQSSIDSTTAVYFQMKEAYEGYKISADDPSRRRVREAINAGLSSLPEWP